MQSMNSSSQCRSAWKALGAACLALWLVACDRPASPAGEGPAEQVGAKVDQAATVAGEKLENFKEKHGPQIEEAKEATADGVRKLTDVVGQQLEKAGQKAQEISRKGDTQEPKQPEQR